MQRQTPVLRHRPYPVRAVLFSAAGASRIRHWHPPTRSDWRCNRTACADNVVAMRTSKDGNAIQSIDAHVRSEEHTSELQSLMRISYDVLCLKKKKKLTPITHVVQHTHHQTANTTTALRQ